MTKKIDVNKPVPKAHDTNIVEESKRTGKMTTDSGAKVESEKIAVHEGAENERPEADSGAFSLEDQKNLVGDLKPGEEGYLPLDREGNVKGPAVRDLDKAGEYHCKVYAHQKDECLYTPSGAPITKRMNADFSTETRVTQ